MSDPPAIIVHSLAQAFAAAGAAAELGTPVTLRSATGAAGYAGVGWFAALAAAVRERYPDLEVDFVLDCADEAGTAMGALRRGLKHLIFTGPDAVARKLTTMGAELDRSEAQALDLLGAGDPAAASRKWLAAARRPR